MTNNLLDQNTKAFESEFESRAAVFVTGETPAVVTETLCMLMRGECHSHLPSGARHKFMPTEIHIITTRGELDAGVPEFVRRWKAPDDRGIGAVLNCLQEYGVESITISLHFMTSEADAEPQTWASTKQRVYPAGYERILNNWDRLDVYAYDAQPTHDRAILEDIRTDADNEAAGNYITRILQGLAQGEGAVRRAIHVSMAGGRKSMSGFTKGAMWLLGRAQDRLSHVLVHKSLESAGGKSADWSQAALGGDRATKAKRGTTRGAYLLTTEPNLTCVGGQQSEAIILSDIPFVRLLALGSPDQLNMEKGVTYSSLVMRTSNLLSTLRNQVITLRITHKNRSIAFPGFSEITLKPQHFALVLLLAAQRQNDLEANGAVRVSWGNKYPTGYFAKFRKAFVWAYALAYPSKKAAPGVVENFALKDHAIIADELSGLRGDINRELAIKGMFAAGTRGRSGLIVSERLGENLGNIYRLTDKVSDVEFVDWSRDEIPGLLSALRIDESPFDPGASSGQGIS